MSEPHIAAPLVRQFVEAMEARGVSRHDLLDEAGIPAAELGLTRLRLPFSRIEDLFEAAERLTGDPRVGFHASEWRDLDVMGLPAMMLVASGTVREGTRKVARFVHLWSTAYKVDATEVPGGLCFQILVRRPERRGLVQLREMLVADGARMVRRVSRAEVRPVEVRFPHPQEGDPSEMEAFFGCPVRFETGETAIVLGDEDLDLRLPTASALLLELFERRADDESSRLSGTTHVAERVRALLRAELTGKRLGTASLMEAATHLRTSPRSLQRALGREGTSFVGELEAVRRSAAEELLQAGTDIAEVSWLLGYAEPAVFHRAFKRWTGGTPDAFRRARRG